MTTQQYKLFLRLIGGAAALTIGGVSIYFAQAGFNITVPHMTWVGWALALTVPAIEMVWNHERDRSSMLFFAGLAAYAFGVVTNVVGLLAAQGYSQLPWDEPWLFIVPFVIGIFLEFVPEPLLMVVLVKDGMEIEDMLSRPVMRARPARMPQASVPPDGREPVRPVVPSAQPPVYYPRRG